MSHRVTEDWTGEPEETLADLLRPGLCAVCVGINPSLTSVAVGHYYQGRLGQRHFERLRIAGLIPPSAGDWEDDEAFAAGVGFTDIVKRATASSNELRREEFEYGKPLLVGKLEANRPKLIVFTFKETAKAILGNVAGNGFIDRELGGAEVFVMPGPMESNATAKPTLRELAEWVRLGNFGRAG